MTTQKEIDHLKAELKNCENVLDDTRKERDKLGEFNEKLKTEIELLREKTKLQQYELRAHHNYWEIIDRLTKIMENMQL